MKFLFSLAPLCSFLIKAVVVAILQFLLQMPSAAALAGLKCFSCNFLGQFPDVVGGGPSTVAV